MKNLGLNTLKLRHYFYIMLVLVISVGCCSNSSNVEIEELIKPEVKTYTITKSGKFSLDYGLCTIDYEGCEYIIFKDGSRAQVEMFHKNNCKYCKKREFGN